MRRDSGQPGTLTLALGASSGVPGFTDAISRHRPLRAPRQPGLSSPRRPAHQEKSNKKRRPATASCSTHASL
ncbi:hypothetical protein E2C01_054173 [Portunus trituberculatus]|uniref:Uncharacterized protein n=1 Tax=Portunus trituberculatus TaxID=210409 RepID=A0A5B7GR86_PORTR|nr:hypothetical protein [Portunus trituberculatus]